MKNRVVKILYHFFSFLADKTNGLKIFVSPKLFFGALIVSGMAISASSCNDPTDPKVTCYDTSEPTCYVAPEPTCYDPVPEDETSKNNKPGDDVLCYAVGPTIEEVSQD